MLRNISLSNLAAERTKKKVDREEFKVEDVDSRQFMTHTILFVIFDILVVFLVGVCCAGLFMGVLKTNERGFYCNDESIKNPRYPNTVSVSMLLTISLLGPLLIALFWEYYLLAPDNRMQYYAKVRQYAANVTAILVDYMIGYTVMVVLMEISKAYFGRLRPHFLTVCKPDPAVVNCSATPNAYIEDAHCTGSPIWVRVGRQSFPSGHSSAAVYCAYFLYLYLLAPRNVPVNLRNTKFVTRLVFSLGYMVFAVFCCASRVTDFWHFPTDVLGGILLGISVTWVLFVKFDSSLSVPRY